MFSPKSHRSKTLIIFLKSEEGLQEILLCWTQLISKIYKKRRKFHWSIGLRIYFDFKVRILFHFLFYFTLLCCEDEWKLFRKVPKQGLYPTDLKLWSSSLLEWGRNCFILKYFDLLLIFIQTSLFTKVCSSNFF